jgi:hypothetical protein
MADEQDCPQGAGCEQHPNGHRRHVPRRYFAVFTTDASTVIEFDADVDHLEGIARKAALENAAYAAYQEKADTNLCHECGSHVTLGDFDLAEEDAIEEVPR